jgi:putative ABC transport system ATP-binding protein
MKDVITLKNVHKVYINGKERLEALRGVDFSVKQNDFIAIMGASGSGKSTLLHISGLLDKPDKGQVFIEGINTTHLDDNQIAEIRNTKLGFIFQQFNLMPHLTAIDNIFLPTLFRDVNNIDRKKAVELLHLVGLKGKGKNRPGEMSGGEQQRVAIARSLINDPDIILADEPTGNLDSKTGKQIMDMLVHLHKEHKKTIVVVTHDPNIASYAKRLVYIKDGNILKDHHVSSKYLWKK